MKKRLLFLMLSACMLCAVSLNYISKDDEISLIDTKETIITGATDISEWSDLNACSDRNEGQTTEVSQAEIEVQSEGEEVADAHDCETELSADLSESYGTEYAYGCLNDRDKMLYREIYIILKDFGTDMPLSTNDPDIISDIFQCVLNDHPEIFYVNGYTYTTYMRDEVVEQLTISGTYTMTREKAEQCQDIIDIYVTQCFAGMDDTYSDYDKVKYVYEYLIANTEYNLLAPDNQNICSVFINGESVCQGYAKAMQYLLNKAGVFCTLVIGSVSEGEGHAWNLVQMDGNYYYVDTTWGDASYQMEEGIEDAWQSKLPDINYDYLGVTTEQLQKTHRFNNVVPLPYCISMECNYYVREGTFIDSCDEESLAYIFDNALSDNEEYITLKCSDSEVYAQVKKLLLDEQKIFHYLRQTDGSVAYSDNDEQHSLSFWLWDES